MTEGTLLEGGTRPGIRLERHLPDPPHVVWDAITDREQLQAWFPTDVDVEDGAWRAGAKITFRFAPPSDMTLFGEVREVERPSLLVFTWGEETLRFELHPDGSGTRLVLVDQLPAAHAARNAAGWDVCLDRLTGVDPGPDGWQRGFERYSAAFEPTLGPQDGPPEGH
ncbi:MAG: activator of Hsp90 ATPase 1 family protein [Acidimicrobiales bacterium]|nr:activator of Hsp90 ATPase 1 family protein [Acidimicrobiales bacterium]